MHREFERGSQMPETNVEKINPLLDRALRQAIQTKHLIQFNYKNQERVAEPHDYGVQNGIVRLFCYQVGGRSSGRLPGWRLINVSEIRDCQILERQFAGDRETPSGTHHNWDKVFIRVSPPGR